MSKIVIEDMICIGEFRGSVPDVPFASGLSADSFKDGDDEPMFVTLPVGEFGAVSGNGRHYPEAVVRDLERQIMDKRPSANLGHIKPEDRSSKHPIPAGYWVGATIQDNKVYAKAYIPKGEVREYFRNAKRVGQKIGTSIYGMAEQVYNKSKGAYDVVKIDLESIDFGSPERIGVKSLASTPVITSELEDENEVVMNKYDVIKELTADDAVILPPVVKASVISASDEVKQLTAVAELVGKEDVLATVKALVAENAQLKADALKGAITSTVAELVAVESARGLVAELVKAKAPTDASAVKALVQEVISQESIKTLLAETVENKAGEPLKVNTGDKSVSSSMFSEAGMKAIAEFEGV